MLGLVLSDINMPNMDGLQLLGELKAKLECKKVPIVMITMEGSHNKVLEAVSLGAAAMCVNLSRPNRSKKNQPGSSGKIQS